MAGLQSAVDRWTEDLYHQRKHSMIGMTPNVRASSVPVRPSRIEDPRALDILLAPCGERVIGKKGLRYENGLYWNDELIDYLGRKVTVRLDVRDAGRLFCFDPAGREFICEAEDMALSGITVADKIRARKLARKALNERVKAMKALARGLPDPLAGEINRIREERATVANLPVGDPVKGNPFVDGAMDAARSDRQDAGLSEREFMHEVPAAYGTVLSEETWESGPDSKVVRFRGKTELETVIPDPPLFANALERFEWLRHQQRDRDLTDNELRWLQVNRREWDSYAGQFVAFWPECDRSWLAGIAGDRFWEWSEEVLK